MRTPPFGINPRFWDSTAIDDVVQGREVLDVGDSGEAVQAVEQALADMGFNILKYTSRGKTYGGVDGVYDDQDRIAVTNFQTFARRYCPRVQITGKVDAETMAALDLLAPPSGTRAEQTELFAHAPPPVYDGKQVRAVVVKNEHRIFVYDAAGRLMRVAPIICGKGDKGHTTDTGLKYIAAKLNQAQAQALGTRLWHDPMTFGPRIFQLGWEAGSGPMGEVRSVRTESAQWLHGTDVPRDFGTGEFPERGVSGSHGCMRIPNQVVLDLWPLLHENERVAVVDDRDDVHLHQEDGMAAARPAPAPAAPRLAIAPPVSVGPRLGRRSA